MHSWIGKKYNYFYNSDFSGDILINDKNGNESLAIDSNELLEFIVEAYLRNIKADKIENMDWKEILKQ
jgi:hypothetical protein